MSKNWKAGDTIIAKGSRAKVLTSDLSDRQNWVTVQYGGQEYQGYQSEFEVKGWRKLDSSMAVVGCGCLTLIGFVFFAGILSSLNKASQYQKTDSTYQQFPKNSNTGNSTSPVPSTVHTTVKPSPVPSPVQRTEKPSPVQRTVKPSPSPPQSPQPIRASQAGNCECPYDTDRAGRACGKRSAYSRLGGRSGAQCYQ